MLDVQDDALSSVFDLISQGNLLSQSSPVEQHALALTALASTQSKKSGIRLTVQVILWVLLFTVNDTLSQFEKYVLMLFLVSPQSFGFNAVKERSEVAGANCNLSGGVSLAVLQARVQLWL